MTVIWVKTLLMTLHCSWLAFFVRPSGSTNSHKTACGVFRDGQGAIILYRSMIGTCDFDWLHVAAPNCHTVKSCIYICFSLSLHSMLIFNVMLTLSLTDIMCCSKSLWWLFYAHLLALCSHLGPNMTGRRVGPRLLQLYLFPGWQFSIGDGGSC